jgi:hypothetical protein
MSARHVITFLKLQILTYQIFNAERLEREVSTLEFNKQQSRIALTFFNNKIETQRKVLTSYRISRIRERRRIGNQQNEKARLNALVTRFKNSNKEYNKLNQAAEENAKSLLTDSRLLLKFATLSVIKSLRSNSGLYNLVIYDNSNNTTISYRPNYSSLVSEQRQQSFNDNYTALILEEAEKLYNKLRTELTNKI